MTTKLDAFKAKVNRTKAEEKTDPVPHKSKVVTKTAKPKSEKKPPTTPKSRSKTKVKPPSVTKASREYRALRQQFLGETSRIAHVLSTGQGKFVLNAPTSYAG